MKHYLKVFLAFFSINSKLYLENRWNTFGNIINSTIVLLLMVFFVEIYFSFTKDIFGWSKHQVILLTGATRCLISLFYFFVFRGITWLPRYVQSGTLDLFLTKPIPSQFYISFRYIRVYEIISFLSGLILVLYSLGHIQQAINPFNLLLLVVSLLLGAVILYGIYFSLATLSIWMGRFAALNDFFYIIREPLSVPTDFLGKNVSTILTFIIPLGLVVTVPVKLFFSKLPPYFIILEVLVAFVAFSFSVWFWNFALKNYTSASS